MYRYGQGWRVFRRQAAAVVSSMLARKIRGLRRARAGLGLEGSQKAHRPAARQQRGESALIEAAPRHKPTRRAMAWKAARMALNSR